MRAAKPANPQELAYASAKYGVRLSCAHRADKYDEYGDFHHLSGWLGANVRSRSLRRDPPRTARRAYWTSALAVSFAGLSQVDHLLHHVNTERGGKWNGRKGNRRIALTIVKFESFRAYGGSSVLYYSACLVIFFPIFLDKSKLPTVIATLNIKHWSIIHNLWFTLINPLNSYVMLEMKVQICFKTFVHTLEILSEL